MELNKTYDPETAEAPWYAQWEQKAYFKPSPQGKEPYAIVIPPPNVTGSLHMGHALNNTLQDVLVRWHRMRGDKTVWVPGTDHGGIATQNVVEKLLRSEKKTRHDLGREKFLERMWQWRKESGDTILMQLRRLGASCDWSRTRFTMDEPCSKAVRHAFVKLYEKGLIYRGPRMVNWCPRDATALADIEVEHEERAGKLWHIRYPFANPQPLSLQGEGGRRPGEGIIVATTRPETMLGDTAVAVNPGDPRYKPFIGKTLKLPLMGREIPIIADDAVESGFGTGAVKVTPAHDPTDFEIGERHKLPQVVVIGFDGKMTGEAGAYAGIDRFEARKRIVADLEAQGLLDKTEDYRLSVAVCYRCETVIEPLVSEQWFLKMKDLASRAAQATRDGRVKIFPSSWEKPYVSWLDNIRDWCISRQIWWGHRIPVYYCGSKCPPVASEEAPKKCPKCGGADLKQDDDVLDTWFSSALWPLSVFGWPDQTEDLKTFYPTSVLVTGHEILYLWVARMVMLGLEFQKDVPFRHVYIHGIVRDKHGKKMSKSLGNVIDPLAIMKQYGTDALRFSMAESSIPGRDLHLSNDSFLKARNFANKLWNASRFVLLNMEGFPVGYRPSFSEMSLADQWIYEEMDGAIDRVSQALSSYNPAEACRVLYEFIWGSYCDWYVEISKIALNGPNPKTKQVKQAMLVDVLDTALRLLHPFMPYETEQLYQAIRPYRKESSESLMIARWPVADPRKDYFLVGKEMRRLQNIVTSIRTARSEMNIPLATKIKCLIRCSDADWKTLLNAPESGEMIRFLARVDGMDISTEAVRPPESAFTVFDGGEIYIPLGGLIDKVREHERLTKNLVQLRDMLARGKVALENKDFLQRAPKEEVESRRQILSQTQKKIEWLERNLEGLS